MRLYWILFTAIFLIGIYVPCEGFFSGTSIQDFVDNIVDIAKFKLEGIKSLNDSTIGHIWSVFKSTYGRQYLSSGEL
jgi:hypothetical protein